MSGHYTPRAGKFTETLVFKAPVIVNDETTDYAVAFTVKGAVEFDAGRDYPESGRDVAESDIICTIYQRSDVTYSMLINHNGRNYRIRRMEPLRQGPRALAMDIWARAIV